MMFDAFIERGQEELKSFYKPYFNTDTDLEAFLFDALDYENGSPTKRQMLYQVQRFVSLANDIEKLRPGRDCLRMLFIKICLESLCSLSGDIKKRQFYDTFISCFSDEGRRHILEHFRLSDFEEECDGHPYEVSHDISLADYFEIIKVTRDQIVHEGIYWETQFFAYDDDSTWLTSIETEEKILRSYTYQKQEKRKITYHFETTLKYERFIYFFTDACVKYIKDFTV